MGPRLLGALGHAEARSASLLGRLPSSGSGLGGVPVSPSRDRGAAALEGGGCEFKGEEQAVGSFFNVMVSETCELRPGEPRTLPTGRSWSGWLPEGSLRASRRGAGL